jgi:arsenite-transporting ATPase
MRIILFTGKGGVGKTTTAAASALNCARQGLKTLVVSTDPAHSLSDALDFQLQPEPTQVCDNLWGQEFDVYYSMKKNWEHMRHLMLTIFKWRGVNNVVAEELSVLPGMEEASSFLWIEKYYREQFYDVLIIDSAPTGETLTLLSLPQVMQSWLTKAFPGQKMLIKAVGKILHKTKGIPLDQGYEELQNLFNKLEYVQKIMLDEKICSIRIVANPARMVIQEAKRAFTYLNLYGYNVDAVIVNRILPEALGKKGSVFEQYVRAQESYLQDIDESFQPLAILKVSHQGKEVFGLEEIESIGDSIYGDRNAAEIFHTEKPFRIEEFDHYFILSMYLPFIGKDDYELDKYGDELVIGINGRKKSILLPRFANFLELKEHAFSSPWLKIHLTKTE